MSEYMRHTMAQPARDPRRRLSNVASDVLDTAWRKADAAGKVRTITYAGMGLLLSYCIGHAGCAAAQTPAETQSPVVSTAQQAYSLK